MDLQCRYKNEPLKEFIARPEGAAARDLRKQVAFRRRGRVQEGRSITGREEEDRRIGGSSTATLAAEPLVQAVRQSYGYPLNVELAPQSADLLNTMSPWSWRRLVRAITSWPQRLVGRLEAPFLHPTIYEKPSLPSPLQETFYACVSYVSRQEATRISVLRMVEATVNRLIEQNPLLMPIELHLACMQAFLILHTIQLWDGDLRQRAQAEAHALTLEGWAFQLHIRVTEAMSNADPEMLSWDDWILYESARRVALVTMLSQGVYETMKYGVCTYVPIMATLSFTTSDRPWLARSGDSWRQEVWGPTARVATYWDYGKRWREYISDSGGRAPDPFAKLLLTPCLGPDYKQFLI
jgi:hypothetical protein